MGDAVITATPTTSGASSITATLHVIPPHNVTYDNPQQFPDTFTQTANVRLNPLSVCFGNIYYREEAGPATSPMGDFASIPASYFQNPGGYSHNPSGFWNPVEDTNYLNVPDIMIGASPAKNLATGAMPIFGSFQWVIPSSYSVSSTGSPSHLLETTVIQAFIYTPPPPPPLGTSTITKGNLPPFTINTEPAP